MPSDSPSQATKAPQIPLSDGGATIGPSSPAPRHMYETKRPPTTPGPTTLSPESSVRRPLAKRARTSGPSESSRASEHLADTELPTDLSPKSIIRCPMVTTLPIEGNSDCRARPFHSELYFDQDVMRKQLELRDSYDLLQRYHLEHLMTPPDFFYPRVALDFYQSVTTRGVWSPTTIHFSINGRPGVLEARQIVEALRIPLEPENPYVFRQWPPVSQRDMVHILSRGTSINSVILWKELSSRMLLVDVVLGSNLFPLQHSVQRR